MNKISKRFVKIPALGHIYSAEALSDAKVIFDAAAPHFAAKLVEKIDTLLNSEDPLEINSGLNLLVSFRRNMFREQPSTVVQEKDPNAGSINESLLAELEKRFGRRIVDLDNIPDADYVVMGEGDSVPDSKRAKESGILQHLSIGKLDAEEEDVSDDSDDFDILDMGD